MNQTSFRPARPVSAVPVLPATRTPGIWAAVPVPDSHDELHHGGQLGRRLPG